VHEPGLIDRDPLERACGIAILLDEPCEGVRPTAELRGEIGTRSAGAHRRAEVESYVRRVSAIRPDPDLRRGRLAAVPDTIAVRVVVQRERRIALAHEQSLAIEAQRTALRHDELILYFLRTLQHAVELHVEVTAACARNPMPLVGHGRLAEVDQDLPWFSE